MARVCELTGTKPLSGNNVSHSNVRVRARWLPNLHQKKFFIPELKQSVTLKLTTRAIRTIDKQGGISAAIFHAKEVKLSERLQKIKRMIAKKRRNPAPKASV